MSRQMYCKGWTSQAKAAFQTAVRRATLCSDFTVGHIDTYPSSGSDTEIFVGLMEIGFAAGVSFMISDSAHKAGLTGPKK